MPGDLASVAEVSRAGAIRGRKRDWDGSDGAGSRVEESFIYCLVAWGARIEERTDNILKKQADTSAKQVSGSGPSFRRRHVVDKYRVADSGDRFVVLQPAKQISPVTVGVHVHADEVGDADGDVPGSGHDDRGS